VTREQRLERLRVELKAGNDGVFVIVSEQTPILGDTSIALDGLLDAPNIGDQLRAVSGEDPIEVPAAKGVTDEMLRSLNHRRDQLRIDRAVLLVFDPGDCARVSRVADDLWKWATVVELDRPVISWKHTIARGVIDSDRYAPALRPADVVGPKEPLKAPSEQ
jgi:hypothetical protein